LILKIKEVFMKKFYLFLVLILISIPNAVKAQEVADGDVSCTKIIQQFHASDKPLTQPEKLKINACYAYCQNTPNYQSAASYCGVDECLVELADTGQVSNWCCNLTKYWSSKTGVKESPLVALEGICRNSYSAQKDFLYCVNDFKINSKISEECCTMIPEIKRYDEDIGVQINSYCGQNRAAQVCKIQYKQATKFSMACCAYARANHNKFLGTKHFVGDDELAELMEGNIVDCQRKQDVAPDKHLTSCLKRYKKDGNFNRDCCLAYYNGVLIPTDKGMNFNSLDAYCYPDKYLRK
jgi:hypothetical protein